MKLFQAIRAYVGQAAIVMLQATFTIPALAQGSPCIDTHDRLITYVEQADQREIVVVGSVESLDIRTGEVGLRVRGGDDDKTVKPARIILGYILGYTKIQREQQLQAQQQPTEIIKEIRSISKTFPLSELSVEKEILRYPDCMKEEVRGGIGRIDFDGTLTFDGDKVKIDGKFSKFERPPATVNPETTGSGKGGG